MRASQEQEQKRYAVVRIGLLGRLGWSQGPEDRIYTRILQIWMFKNPPPLGLKRHANGVFGDLMDRIHGRLRIQGA